MRQLFTYAPEPPGLAAEREAEKRAYDACALADLAPSYYDFVRAMLDADMAAIQPARFRESAE